MTSVRRSARWMIGLYCAAMLCGGCTTARSRNPFAAKSDSRTTRNSKNSKAVASRTSKSTSGRSNRSGNEAAGGDQENGQVVQAGGSTTGHDPATNAYIDRELRDASPEEREALVKDLQGVHPDMVRQVLRVRRMRMNYQRQTTGQTKSEGTSGDNAAAGRAQRTIEQASWSAPVESTSGLGTTTPWSGPAEAGSNPAGAGRADAAPGQPIAKNPGVKATDGTGQGPPAGPLAAGYGNSDRSELAGGEMASVGLSKDVSALESLPLAPGGNSGNRAAGDAPVQLAGAETPAPGTLGNLVPGQFNGSPTSAPSPGLVASVQRAASRLLPGGGSTGASTTAAGAAGPLAGHGGSAAGGSDFRTIALQQLIDLSAAEAAQAKPGTTDAERQAYIEKQVYLRMLYLIAGQHERALQAIAGLDPADQEFWQQTFWGLANYFDNNAIPDPADRATQTAAQLKTAVNRLQQKANLELRNGSFCQKISSFGNFERFPRDEFSPGQLVDLYLEVDNFHSEPTADGQYRTILHSKLEFHKPGPQGEMEDEIKSSSSEDLCRNHRRDFFLSQEFSIPARLATGPHVLKVIVEDQLSRKVATYALNFTVK